jgi:aspartyl/asparaginyl-tRNA synthetase
MNEDKIQVAAVTKVIAKDFQIGEEDSLIPATDVINFNELKKYLTEKLSYLLEHKYDTLLNILYKIDVSEEKLGELFSGSNRDSIPEALAELIIERQLQKVRFRQLYKNGKF